MRCTRDHNSCFITRYNIIENVLLLRDQHLERKNKSAFRERRFQSFCHVGVALKTSKHYYWELFFILRICLSHYSNLPFLLCSKRLVLKPFGSHHVCEHVVVVSVVVRLECRVPFDEESFSKQKMSALRRECGVQISREKARREIERRRRRDVSFFSFRRDEEENPTADV